MHILHLVKTSETAIWVFDLISKIKEIDTSISFSICLPEGGKHFHKYQVVCINVYRFDFNIDRSLLRRGLELREIVRKEKPDIIHSWYTQTTFYARLFLRSFKIPRIFEVLGPFHLEFPFYRYFDILSSQKSDYWKATSECTYKLYLKYGVPNERLFLNYIAVDFNSSLLATEQSPPLNLRAKHGIPGGIKIIGTASYMYGPKLFRKHGIKNHELLLEVFAELMKRRNDVVLFVGGTALFPKDRSYEEKLKNRASQISRDRIFFTGWVENLGRLITEYDVFVFLSLSENLGGVYESLLYRVPTVASDRGGIPELVIDGETGFSCKLNSVDEIVDRIELLLDNEILREKFRSRGFGKVLDLFNMERSINKSIEIYNTVLSRYTGSDVKRRRKDE